MQVHPVSIQLYSGLEENQVSQVELRLQASLAKEWHKVWD